MPRNEDMMDVSFESERAVQVGDLAYAIFHYVLNRLVEVDI